MMLDLQEGIYVLKNEDFEGVVQQVPYLDGVLDQFNIVCKLRPKTIANAYRNFAESWSGYQMTENTIGQLP